PTMDLRLVVSEYLGAQSTLVTRCGSEDVLVEHNSSIPPRAGSTMTFAVRTDEIMAFDPHSGVRL
ncbi:MAG: sugar ABC transporter ATP-binding protein, partial [Pseudomonadota bacterium]